MIEAPIKLAGYFLEWQLIEDAKSELADRSKDLFKAMKEEGYDTKAARAVFREKRAELNATSEDVAKAEEAGAIQDLYRAALDSGLTARAGRARETQESGSVDQVREGSAVAFAGTVGRFVSEFAGTSSDRNPASSEGSRQSALVSDMADRGNASGNESVTAGETAPEADAASPAAAALGAASAQTAPSPSGTLSQSAESPTADKPEAHAQPLSDASGALSKREYSEDEILRDEDVPAFLKREVA